MLSGGQCLPYPSSEEGNDSPLLKSRAMTPFPSVESKILCRPPFPSVESNILYIPPFPQWRAIYCIYLPFPQWRAMTPFLSVEDNDSLPQHAHSYFCLGVHVPPGVSIWGYMIIFEGTHILELFFHS